MPWVDNNNIIVLKHNTVTPHNVDKHIVSIDMQLWYTIGGKNERVLGYSSCTSVSGPGFFQGPCTRASSKSSL